MCFITVRVFISRNQPHRAFCTSVQLTSPPSLPAQALFPNSSADDRGEPLDEEEEEEDHTYELLLTAETKVPPPSQESHSSKGESENHSQQVFTCLVSAAVQRLFLPLGVQRKG